MNKKLVGAKLRAKRQELGLTLDEVGKQLGVTRQAVSSWERGINQVPDNSKIELAKLYGERVGDLFF